MDTLIANVAKKKGIRSGVVLAGYDLDRKEPTAVAAAAGSPGPVGNTFSIQKESAIAVTATTEAAPQTVITMVTPELQAGMYMFAYSFQVTHGTKNEAMYFKVGGDLADAAFFANSSSDRDELHLNRYYAYPKQFAGGVLTLSLEMYKPIGTVTVDFVDLAVYRLGD